MGWKSFFTPTAILRFSVPLLLTLLVALFCPTWILIMLCVALAGFYKKWYSQPGYWAVVVLVFGFLVLPLSLQWAYDISSLQGLLDIYNIIQPVTPRPPSIPLFNVSLENSFSITPNLDMVYIWTFFSFVIIASWIIIKIKQVRKAFFMFTSAVAIFYGILVGVSWFSWVVNFFSVGQIDIAATLFNWDQFIIFYHLIFTFFPLFVINVSLIYLVTKLGVYF